LGSLYKGLRGIIQQSIGWVEGVLRMEHFWELLTKPDNIPIAGMLLAVIFCLGVAFRQALKNDKLIAQGRKDDVYSEMIK
jgi:hypothetical protein